MGKLYLCSPLLCTEKCAGAPVYKETHAINGEND